MAKTLKGGVLFESETTDDEKPEELTSKGISPFAFVDAIHYTKKRLIVDEETEKQYNSYIVNRALSFGQDTILYANEMNIYGFLAKKVQFDFLLNTIRARKRFNKWLKPEKQDALDVVKAYFGYGTEKATVALGLLTPEQLEAIKNRLYRGGRDEQRRESV